MSPASDPVTTRPSVTRFWEDWPSLGQELAAVRTVIESQVAEGGTVLQGALRGLVRSDGKLLRPAFLLLSAQFGVYDPQRFQALGAAVEMLHMATLVHDDIIDDSPLRRGEPALHVARGARDAVLLGDWLFSRCFQLMADRASLANARSLAGIVSRICGSEVEQAAAQFVSDGSLRRYLRRIGYSIGMGFQIVDDVLDWEGAGGVTGKPVMADLRQGIYTLPVLCALRRDDGELGRALADFHGGDGDLPRLSALVRARAGIGEARRNAALYTRRALCGIEGLPENGPRAILREIASRLLVRAY